MSVHSVLAQGRAAVEQLLVDTCRIERLADRGEFNQTTGDYDPTWEVLYEGRCRLKNQSAGSGTEYGEHEVNLPSYQLVLPWDVSPEIRETDRVTITTSGDSWLIGRSMEVTGVDKADLKTARRLNVQDRT